MRGPQIRLPIQLWTLWLLVNPGSGLPLQRSASEAMEESIPLQGVELGSKYDIFAGSSADTKQGSTFISIPDLAQAVLYLNPTCCAYCMLSLSRTG